MQASLDMARGKISAPRSYGGQRHGGGDSGGRGRGGRGNHKGGRGGRGGGGPPRRYNRNKRAGTPDANGLTKPSALCRKEGSYPIRGHGYHSRSECPEWKAMRKEILKTVMGEMVVHVNQAKTLSKVQAITV